MSTTVPGPTTLALPFHAKPTVATTTDGTRPALEHGHVIEEDGKRVLITSDSYILARYPVGDDVPLGPIHPDALKCIEEQAHDSSVLIDVGDGQVTAKRPGEEIVWRPMADGKMPFTEKPAPQYKEGAGGAVSIAFDVDLVQRLAKALGVLSRRGLRLDIPVDEGGKPLPQAIRATPLDGGEVEGLLMPMKLEDQP